MAEREELKWIFSKPPHSIHCMEFPWRRDFQSVYMGSLFDSVPIALFSFWRYI